MLSRHESTTVAGVALAGLQRNVKRPQKTVKEWELDDIVGEWAAPVIPNDIHYAKPGRNCGAAAVIDIDS